MEGIEIDDLFDELGELFCVTEQLFWRIGELFLELEELFCLIEELFHKDDELFGEDGVLWWQIKELLQEEGKLCLRTDWTLFGICRIASIEDVKIDSFSIEIKI